MYFVLLGSVIHINCTLLLNSRHNTYSSLGTHNVLYGHIFLEWGQANFLHSIHLACWEIVRYPIINSCRIFWCCSLNIQGKQYFFMGSLRKFANFDMWDPKMMSTIEEGRGQCIQLSSLEIYSCTICSAALYPVPRSPSVTMYVYIYSMLETINCRTFPLCMWPDSKVT